jgi:hypothetical protein
VRDVVIFTDMLLPCSSDVKSPCVRWRRPWAAPVSCF